MVSSAQKRRAAGSVVKAGWCSRRKACRFLWLARSTWHYVPLAPTPRQIQLDKEILALSHAHPRYGYRRIHAVLHRKGLRCALRTVQRVRRREGLQVFGPAVRPKCPPRPDAKVKSDGVNDVWCVDVVFDTTQSRMGCSCVLEATTAPSSARKCMAFRSRADSSSSGASEGITAPPGDGGRRGV